VVRENVIAWKLCTSMKVEDVTATLDWALQASGLDQAKPANRPRLGFVNLYQIRLIRTHVPNRAGRST
jgi:hypothetical protein